MGKRTGKKDRGLRAEGMIRSKFLETSAAGEALPWLDAAAGAQGAGAAGMHLRFFRIVGNAFFIRFAIQPQPVEPGLRMRRGNASSVRRTSASSPGTILARRPACRASVGRAGWIMKQPASNGGAPLPLLSPSPEKGEPFQIQFEIISARGAVVLP